MVKRFFYVCAGILCLALAYHLGASSASAQAEGHGKIRHIVAWGDQAWIVTDADEIYSVDRNKAPSVSRGVGWVKFRLGMLN